ncbi:MAG: hypothetical protein WA892_09105 [Ornithinimicrobium sp.]
MSRVVPALATRWRQVANAVNLSTALGLGLAGLGGARVTLGPGGLLLAERYRCGSRPAPPSRLATS